MNAIHTLAMIVINMVVIFMLTISSSFQSAQTFDSIPRMEKPFVWNAMPKDTGLCFQ